MFLTSEFAVEMLVTEIVILNPPKRKTYIRFIDFIFSRLFKVLASLLLFFLLSNQFDLSYLSGLEQVLLIIALLLWVNGIKDSLYFEKREGRDISNEEFFLPILFLLVLMLGLTLIYF